MAEIKASGRGASAVKYDILTALLAWGLAEGGAGGRLAPRLAVLITARFNWQTGVLAVGQREIARLWSVTERTAKREIAAMRARGWLVVRRPAARGRVTEHGLDLARILEKSRPVWPAVGPDFVARLAPEEAPRPAGNVVPFVRTGDAPTDDGSAWAIVSRLLWAEDPALHGAWLARLVEREVGQGRAVLLAPTPFIAAYIGTHLTTRIVAAWRQHDRTIQAILVTAG